MIVQLLKNVLIKKDYESTLQLFNKIIEEESNNYKINFIVDKLEDEKITCYSENDSIYFDKKHIESIEYNDLNKDNSIIMYIKKIYHEIRHALQYNLTINNIFDELSLQYIKCNLINDYYDTDEYKRNYYIEEIEVDANIFAWTKTKKLLLELNSEKYKEIINKIDIEIKRNCNYLLCKIKVNKNNNIVSTYKYIPNILDKIVIDNNEVLDKYKQLLYFYNNGKRKNINELFDDHNFIDNYKKCRLFFETMILNYFLEDEIYNEKNIKYIYLILNNYLDDLIIFKKNNKILEDKINDLIIIKNHLKELNNIEITNIINKIEEVI